MILFDPFGVAGISVALVLGIFFATVMGILYGMLLNRIKGSEMIVSTYVGWSCVALFNILWLTLPFRNSIAIWPAMGRGLRSIVNLNDDFGGVFNNQFAFSVGQMDVPTGLLIVFFFCCFLVWVFGRSRLGMMMSAAGSNPDFARASGINVDKMRILGTTLSTVLGAVGIIVYAQGFGFLQLYNAPLMMGFASVAAILIGGASIRRARVFDVLLGAFLFHGILTIALPVANQIIPQAGLSEILRVIITNGIILYALSKAKEGVR